jgi:hypothetical protein
MKKNPLSETDEKRLFARFCPTFPTLGLLMLALLCVCELEKVEATPSILPAATPSTYTDNSALQTSLYRVIETTIACQVPT